MRRIAIVLLLVSCLAAAVLAIHRYRSASPYERLMTAAAAMPYRITEARLTNFGFAPMSRVRDANTETASQFMRFRAAALELAAAREGADAPPVAIAVANALNGRCKEADELLAHAIDKEPSNAAYWSDRAAILHDCAVRRADTATLARSLAAADRALDLAPRHPEATFNRALILSALRLDAFARTAFDHYLTIDRRSAWAAEAIARREKLERTTPADLFARIQATIEEAPHISTADIDRLVAASPRDARRYGEGPLITSWAEAVLAGRPAAAEKMLERAAAIGRSLGRSGEGFLSDAVDATRKTGDEVRLARALQTYKAGRIAYARLDLAPAAAALQDALHELESMRHPMAIVARYYVALLLSDDGEAGAAHAQLARVERALPHDYIALRAQVQWAWGTAHARVRRYGDAEQSYKRAAELFLSLGEHQDAARLQHMLAHVLTLLGRHGEAWQVRAQAFAAAADAGDASLLAGAASETAEQAMVEQEWDVAHSFYALVLSAAGRNPHQENAARAGRALASWRAGRAERAAIELEDATRAASSLSDRRVREEATQALAFAKALMIEQNDPRQAAELVRRAIVYHRQRGNAYAIPWLLATDARLLRREGALSRAIERLEEARRTLDEAAHGLTEVTHRDSFYGTADGVTRDLMSAYLEAARAATAFEVIEHQRSRILLEPLGAASAEVAVTSLNEIARMIDPHTVMLHYTIIGERVWLFTIRRHQHAVTALETKASVLATAVARLRRAVDAADERDVARAGGILYDALVAPAGDIRAAKKIVFVLDEALAGLPLPALFNGTYLIEQAEVVAAPSASVYAAGCARRARMERRGLLSIADPAFDRVRYPTLHRLPAAAQEGREVAALYTPRLSLHGDGATLANVVASLGNAGTIHFAAHATIDEREPSASAFLLAPTSGGGELTVRQIASTDLRGVHLVVAAGCRTASRANTPGALSSLTAAFLVAGACNVVGALWDLDDGATHAFSVSFHRKLASGMPPAAAIRATQIEMLRSRDPVLRRPSSWAGLRLYGS